MAAWTTPYGRFGCISRNLPMVSLTGISDGMASEDASVWRRLWFCAWVDGVCVGGRTGGFSGRGGRGTVQGAFAGGQCSAGGVSMVTIQVTGLSLGMGIHPQIPGVLQSIQPG